MAKIRVYVNEPEDLLKIVSLEDIAVIQDGGTELGFQIKYKQGLVIVLSIKEGDRVLRALVEA